MYNVISQLVYATGRHQVSDVWIAGVRKLRDREPLDIDLRELRDKARRWRDRIAEPEMGSRGVLAISCSVSVPRLPARCSSRLRLGLGSSTSR